MIYHQNNLKIKSDKCVVLNNSIEVKVKNFHYFIFFIVDDMKENSGTYFLNSSKNYKHYFKLLKNSIMSAKLKK